MPRRVVWLRAAADGGVHRGVRASRPPRLHRKGRRGSDLHPCLRKPPQKEGEVRCSQVGGFGQDRLRELPRHYQVVCSFLIPSGHTKHQNTPPTSVFVNTRCTLLKPVFLFFCGFGFVRARASPPKTQTGCLCVLRLFCATSTSVRAAESAPSGRCFPASPTRSAFPATPARSVENSKPLNLSLLTNLLLLLYCFHQFYCVSI